MSITTIFAQSGAVILVSEEDFEWASKHSWSITRASPKKKFYAKNPEGQYLHRMILNAPSGYLVDHKNGITLDNRRENLRLCSDLQNIANTPVRKTNLSGFKGVSFHKRCGLYQARIRMDGKRVSLGYFEDPEVAASVYATEHQKLYGEFSYDN